MLGGLLRRTLRQRCCALPPKSKSRAHPGPGACPLSDFYTGEGDAYRKLRPDELLTRIFLPESSAGYRGVYRKLRVRGSIDYPLAGVAVVMKRSNGHIADARVAITAVNPAPLLVNGAGELLAGKKMDESWPGRLATWRRKWPSAYYVGADAGVSAGDDSGVYEEGSAGCGGELVAPDLAGCPEGILPSGEGGTPSRQPPGRRRYKNLA